MSILKNKVAHRLKLQKAMFPELEPVKSFEEEIAIDDSSRTETTSTPEPSTSEKSGKTKRRKIPGGHITPEKIRCAKNIAKNYGRAISNFACSKIAEPYLLPILQAENVQMKEFTDYMKATKLSINGIDSFRAMLLRKDGESEQVAAYKRVFQQIGKVFVNYFSVNWIFDSKIVHKVTYLKFRFKILRRLKNPESFTYMKG